VAAQLLAVEAGVDTNPPWARVHMSDGVWVTLRAARIGSAGAIADSDIAVTIEETTPPERVTLFARASGLSARESELLSHLVTGADTRELAGRMFLSEHTVQDHLKSIFAKTSTHNRRTLLSHVLG
jgi:DNA-binding CsgD family transcriptional regulator